MKSGKPVGSVKRSRPSRFGSSTPKHQLTVPVNSANFDHLDHFPIVDGTRNRCKNSNCTGKTNIKCKKCKVNLCLNKNSSCYEQYHEQ